jgi:hypothetical protein
MVENWSHALQFAGGDYVSYFTDKMFVLPDALGRVEQALVATDRPEVVSWPGDGYHPDSFQDYFGPGSYGIVPRGFASGQFRRFSPSEALDRRGRGEVARGEQTSADYSRGKIVFGAFRRDLVDRIVHRYGGLFRNINPDYTSMVLGLTAARTGIEMAASCVVSVNTDISNGMINDNSDVAVLAFLSSLEGGLEAISADMLVPGLYVSLHNLVAHDYLSLKRRFDLDFEFSIANWLVYCFEDVYRPSRRWSDPSVEADQKGRLTSFMRSLKPAVVGEVNARRAARAARKPKPRAFGRRVYDRLTRWGTSKPSIIVASSLSEAIGARVDG